MATNGQREIIIMYQQLSVPFHGLFGFYHLHFMLVYKWLVYLFTVFQVCSTLAVHTTS